MKIEYSEQLVSEDAGLSCVWVCFEEGFKIPFVIRSFFEMWMLYTPADDAALERCKKAQEPPGVSVPHEFTRGFLQKLQKDWGVSKHDLDTAVLEWRKANKHGQPTPA